MTALQEFLDGEPLQYRGRKKVRIEATYRAGVGIFLERLRDNKDLGCAGVTDDIGATRVYWNLRRGTDGEESEEQER